MNRRRFLQGMGGSLLALPLLEANSASPHADYRRGDLLEVEVPQHFHPEQAGRQFVRKAALGT